MSTAKKKLLFKRRVAPVSASTPAPGFDSDSSDSDFLGAPKPPKTTANGPTDDTSGVDLFRRSKNFFPRAIEEQTRRLQAEKQRHKHTHTPTSSRPGPSPSPGPNLSSTKRRKVSRETPDDSPKSARVRSSQTPPGPPSPSPAQCKIDTLRSPTASPLLRTPRSAKKGKGLSESHSVNSHIVFEDVHASPPPDDTPAAADDPLVVVNDSLTAANNSSAAADDSVIVLEDSEEDGEEQVLAKPKDGNNANANESLAVDDDGSDIAEAIDPEFEEYIIRARARDAAARAIEAVRDSMEDTAATTATMSQESLSPSLEPTPNPSGSLSSSSLPSGDQNYRIFITPHLREPVPPLIANVRMNQKMHLVQDAFIQHVRGKGLPLTDEEAASIILTWKGNKTYSWTTGLSLGIRPDAYGRFRDDVGSGSRSSSMASTRSALSGFISGGLHLEAWTEELYEAYLQKQERRRQRNLGEIVIDDEDSSDDEDARNGTGNGGGQGAAGVGAGGTSAAGGHEPVRLVLKSRDHEPLNMSAHADTTVATLIAAFREQRQIPTGKTIAIHWDGERLAEEMTVAEAEMEDMDNVEVFIH